MTPEPVQAKSYELARGTTLGKYEIVRLLAVGGMAEIYLARSRGTAGFEKLVVLKRILPTFARDPDFVAMFLDEARLAATLQHSNIADVYDVGDEDGVVFFTMEYVHGQDVRTMRIETHKRGEAMPLDVALGIIEGTTSALDYAHEKVGPDGKPLGLIHRDVSSSNVLVSYEGAVKLVDFGIARASSSEHRTQTGTLKGKIPYMSPEQCRGAPMDRRSDLFSLGVLLYELSVGRRPFRGDSDFEVMNAIVRHDPQPPSQIRPGYPAELEAIVQKLLERDPDQRYQTGEQVLVDLHDVMAQHQLLLRPKALGKYMRSLFSDKIAAWEHAQAQGIAFVDHVAETITGKSVRSELVTPPSSFPAIPPRAASQAGAARAVTADPVQRASSEQPVQRASSEPAQRASSEPVQRASSEPVQRASSEPVVAPPVGAERSPASKRLLMIGAALMLGTIGVIGGYALTGKRADPPAAQPPASDSSRVMMTTTPAAPAPVPPSTPEPAAIAAPESTPEPAATAVPPSTPEPAAAPESAPAPAVGPPPRRAPPRGGKPTRTTKHAKDPAKQSAPPKADPKKETTWDIDSPVLPH